MAGVGGVPGAGEGLGHHCRMRVEFHFANWRCPPSGGGVGYVNVLHAPEVSLWSGYSGKAWVMCISPQLKKGEGAIGARASSCSGGPPAGGSAWGVGVPRARPRRQGSSEGDT